MDLKVVVNGTKRQNKWRWVCFQAFDVRRVRWMRVISRQFVDISSLSYHPTIAVDSLLAAPVTCVAFNIVMNIRVAFVK